ncbi:MAG: hypothetical protein AAFQ57_12430 [Cyanobacteria bacterium J06626_14]
MIILSAQELQKHGVTASVTSITLMGKVFTRGQTIARRFKKEALSLAHDIQRTGCACLLVDSGAYLTLWRESDAPGSTPTLNSIPLGKLNDWSGLNALLPDSELEGNTSPKYVLKYRGRFVRPPVEPDPERTELPSGLVESSRDTALPPM